MATPRPRAHIKRLRATLVADRHTTADFEMPEHDIYAVTALVATSIVLDRAWTGPITGNAGAYPIVLRRLAKPVGIVVPVRDQLIDSRQRSAQRSSADMVAHSLPGMRRLQSRDGYLSEKRTGSGAQRYHRRRFARRRFRRTSFRSDGIRRCPSDHSHFISACPRFRRSILFTPEMQRFQWLQRVS